MTLPKMFARLAATALAGLLLGHPASAGTPLVVAEPVHSLGYLPLYVAIHKGFFAAEDLEVRVMTIDSGSGHTNAVLSGQAFAFIGGPEHNAFAKAKGGELRAVVNVVDRGNVYLVAAKDIVVKDGDYAAALKGKAIATGFFGGTPNSITRYLADKWKLKIGTDVTLVETANAAVLATVKTGKAAFGVTTEPFLTQGVAQGIWGEPIYNIPKELGPYAYSTLNVRASSIEKEPKQVEGFVRAVAKGLRFTYEHPDEAVEVARKEFPTMPAGDLKATLDRSFKDEIWSHDGTISAASWSTGKSVVMDAGILKQDVPYEAIIDMRFVPGRAAAK
ncbi:ABC transporter substrate-binding protein [Rhodoplanes roseus]|uniref:SsuA/THI5-like domain-containing protein n=1 Tax=Rhodoplanes roseus TaxID=29409 RepID=A0A327KPS7_9BRAD|nr:ABC transporter substrate-binding protein [Rhodoplanes roseus]RAI39623.1 hypothetical protein CH341_25480 [Rhodoplanes roseus]